MHMFKKLSMAPTGCPARMMTLNSGEVDLAVLVRDFVSAGCHVICDLTGFRFGRVRRV